MMTVTIMKKAKNLKTRLGIFKRMGGNIPGENFLGGNFPGGSFPGGSFPDTKADTFDSAKYPILKCSWSVLRRCKE